MPTFKITDPSSGWTIRVTGDTAPGPEDIEDLFSHGSPEPKPIQSEQAQQGTGGKVLSAVLKPLAYGAKVLDSFTGAPIRQGINEMQNYSDTASAPSAMGVIGRGLAGAAKQFGGNTDNVPTGKSIYERAGFSASPSTLVMPNFQPKYGKNDTAPGPSSAGALGFALDMATPVPGAGAVGNTLGMGAKVLGVAGKAGVKAAGKTVEGVAKVADLALNTEKATKAVQAVKGGLNATAEGIVNLKLALKDRFGATLDKEAPKFIKIAHDNGIDPERLHESVIFGPTSSQARLARAEAEGITGPQLMKKHADTQEAIQGAIQNDIKRIGGDAPLPKNTDEAGALVKTAYDTKVSDILGSSEMRYKNLAEQSAGAKIPKVHMDELNKKLSDVEGYATELGADSFDPLTKHQSEHLLETVAQIRSKGDDLKSLTNGMQGLGKTAFRTKPVEGMLPNDVEKLQGIYKTLSKVVTGGFESKFGPDVANELSAYNKAVSEMIADKKFIPALGKETQSDDKLFRSLILNGDSKKINTLKKYLSPEQLQQTKAAALQVLLKEDKGFKTMRNRIGNKEDAFNALFDSGELKNLNDLIDLGERQGSAVLSSSGTGASQAYQKGWSDFIRPTKLLDKTEKAADKAASVGQNKAKLEAINAVTGNTPPSANLAEKTFTLKKAIHNGPSFKKKGLQLYGAEQDSNAD